MLVILLMLAVLIFETFHSWAIRMYPLSDKSPSPSERVNHIGEFSHSPAKNPIQILFRKISGAWQSFIGFFAKLFTYRGETVETASATVRQNNHHPHSTQHILGDGSIAQPVVIDGSSEFSAARNFLWAKINASKDLPSGQADYDPAAKAYAKLVVESSGNHIHSVDLPREEREKDLIAAMIILGQYDAAERKISQLFGSGISSSMSANSLTDAGLALSSSQIAQETSPAIAITAEPVPVDIPKTEPLGKTESSERAKALFNKCLNNFSARGKDHKAWVEFYERDCIEYAEQLKSDLKQQRKTHVDAYQCADLLLKKYGELMRETRNAARASQPEITLDQVKSEKAEFKQIDKAQQAKIRDELFEKINSGRKFFQKPLFDYVQKFHEHGENLLGKNDGHTINLISANFSQKEAFNLKALAQGLSILADAENADEPDKRLFPEKDLKHLSDADKASVRAVKDCLDVLQEISEKYPPAFGSRIGKFIHGASQGSADKSSQFSMMLAALFRIKDGLSTRIAALEPTSLTDSTDAVLRAQQSASADKHTANVPIPASEAALPEAEMTAAASSVAPGATLTMPDWPRRLYNLDQESASASDLRQALGFTGLNLDDFKKLTLVPAARYFHAAMYGTDTEVSNDGYAAAITLAAKWPFADKNYLRQANWTEKDIAALDLFLDVQRITNHFEGYARRDFVADIHGNSRGQSRQT